MKSEEKVLFELLLKGRVQPYFSSSLLGIRESKCDVPYRRKPIFMGSPALTFCFLPEIFGSRASRISAFIKTQALTLKVREKHENVTLRGPEACKTQQRLQEIWLKFGLWQSGEIDMVSEFVRKFALECYADG